MQTPQYYRAKVALLESQITSQEAALEKASEFGDKPLSDRAYNYLNSQHEWMWNRLSALKSSLGVAKRCLEEAERKATA